MPKIILVAGIPASGKSTYCGWLRAAKGFVHLDVDRDVETINREIEEAGSLTTFIDRLRALGRPVVIDWGFPPGSAPVVHLLGEAGVDLWWFDGDPVALRAAYIKRGRGSVDDFERQMGEIADAGPMIANLFGDQRVTV